MQRLAVLVNAGVPAEIFIPTVIHGIVIHGADLAHQHLAFSGFSVEPVVHALFEAYTLPRLQYHFAARRHAANYTVYLYPYFFFRELTVLLGTV